MPAQPYQRTSLRGVLLDQAELVLKARGIEALSLRELAREAGVSHGAPRSHFIDRKALLDALAERGFGQLGDFMKAAADAEVAGDEPSGYAASLRSSARAYLTFAVDNAALLDLMFAAKMDTPPATLLAAAERFFVTIREVVGGGAQGGAFAEADADQLTLLVSVTMQGIATFVGSRRITMSEGEQLIDLALDRILVFGSAPSKLA